MKMVNKMKSVLNNRKSIYQYVVIYILIFAIPFLILSIIWYNTSRKNIQNQIENGIDNSMFQLKEYVSEKFDDIANISEKISDDARITPYMMNHPYYSKEGIAEINRYKNSTLVEDLFIQYDEYPDTLYTSTGKMAFSTFIERRYAHYQLEKETIQQLFNAKVPEFSIITTRNSEESNDLICYTMPIMDVNGSKYGTVSYLIKKNNLLKDTEKLMLKQNGNVLIFDQKGQLILSSNDSYLEDRTSLKELALDESKQKIKLDDNKLQINRQVDSKQNLIFIALTNPRESFDEIAQIHYRTVGAVLLLFVGSVALIYTTSKKQYQPIKKIEKILASKLDIANNDNRQVPLDQLQQSLVEYFETNETLIEEIKSQTPYARDKIVGKLLQGDFESVEEIEMLLRAVTIELYDKNYFVMILSTEFAYEEITDTVETYIMNKVDVFYNKDYQIFGTKLVSAKAIALICSTANEIDNWSTNLIVDEIYQSLLNDLQIAMNIGIGTVVANLNDINKSYIEAMAVIDYQKHFDLENTIIHFSDIKENEKSSKPFQPEEQLKLMQSLNEGNFVVAQEVINTLINDFASKQSSVNSMKLFGYNLLNTIIKSGVELCDDSFYQLGEQLSGFDSLVELRVNSLSLAEKICIQIANKPKNNILKQEIFDYINEHYSSPDLSLESVAEEFDLSVSYISRFIKKESDRTFSKYIQDLRLEKIKQQLVETDKPIKEIVQENGYYDVSNYTRKFKNIMGVTPGQYRKIQRHEYE
ncbi:helix-turn-helix domain-containing protein [Vagococcus zengguangii]|uniref:Helix-turn-helix domain-containing protein n=1 Tax=Vagococcus zengguangii TaxID=2571750 RepID=A0A4D7CV65_9ENTE|nr:helix-turn-helix domain-containing protein [Vagococcus zengguangii]QCI86191.1 helix-turn-helix domain-containing protein [Vagococcus zengguangii]